MIRRGLSLGLALLVGAASAARAQGVTIDHQAVACIVVGKYPKMNACFTPAAALARSRVYFRPEGVTSWYYVDMKTDQPCFTGTLPRPGKKLVGKKIEYYVEAQNKTFEPARTAEYAPVVVRSAQECKKDAPVAPFVNNAVVAVFPALPAGFVGGGVGTAAVIGIAGAGAAAAGTAVAVASHDSATTTTAPVAGTPTTTTLATATTTTTTPPAKANHAPFAVLATNPDPASGQGPLTVTFDLCKSTDPDGDPLSFFFDFGDGSKTSGSCVESHTYQASFKAAGDLRALDRAYSAQACVVDTANASACRERVVTAISPPPPVTTPSCPTPTITLINPVEGSCIQDNDIPISATATNTTQVKFTAEHCLAGCGVTEPDNSIVKTAPFSGTLFVSHGDGQYQIFATASNACGAPPVTTPPHHFFDQDSCGCPCAFQELAEGRRAAWWSELGLASGRLQLAINGGAPMFLTYGTASGTARLAEGENRVEAVLVDAARPGPWRFDLRATEAIQPGSLRVISGEVLQLGPMSVTFRLRGTQGERIAFTFLKK
jgi:PKD domain